MGAGGSSIGDLFFPDNPNRRRRAQELKDQINAYCAEFHQVAAQREEKLNRIRTKLDAIMASRGFETTQQLEDRVRLILDSKQLADYDNFKSRLDLSDKVQGIIWDAVGIIGVASGVIIGGAVVLGFVTGGAAIAALGAIGEVLAVIGVIVIIFGVIEGAIERSKLRDAINEMWPQRAKAKQAVEQMRVVVNWVDAIETWLDNEVTSDPKVLDSLLNAGFDPEYRSWDMDRVYNFLRDMDRENGSWTDEDPGRGALYTAAMAGYSIQKEGEGADAIIEANIKPEDGSPHETGVLAYDSILTKESCNVSYAGSKWQLTAVEWNEEKPELETTRFKMERLEEEGQALAKACFAAGAASLQCCKIDVVAYSTR